MKRILKILFFFINLGIINTPAFTQTKIQVVSRTVYRTFEHRPGQTIDIKGEKANIQVKQSKDNIIKIKLTLVSKNPSRRLAEQDLKYCDYQLAESSNILAISNFFNSKGPFKEISSNLTAKYEIEVPENIVMKLKNIYGDIELNGIDANIHIDIDFGRIQLSDISGNLSVHSNYSDMNGQNIKAILNIQAQKVDIVLSNTNNSLKIKDQYGSIYLEKINANIDISAEMTAINVNVDNPALYSLDFTAKEGELIVPEKFSEMVVNKQGQNKLITSGGKISIKVATTYNTITLKTE